MSAGVTAPRAAPRPAACGSEAATARRQDLRAAWRADKLEQRVQHAGMAVHVGVTVADLGKARRHRGQREVGRVAHGDLVPRQRRRDARIRPRPHRIRTGDRPVLGVLVVVEKHAMTFFLPPLARRAARARAARPRAPAPAPRAGPGRTSSAARCARRRASRGSPRSLASRPDRDRRASPARRRRPRESAATPRPGTGSRSTRSSSGWSRSSARTGCGCSSRHARLAIHTKAAGSLRHDLFGRPARRKLQLDDLQPRRPRLRRPLLKEELAADAVRIAHQDVGPAAGALQRTLRRPRCSSARDPAWCGPPAGTAPCEGSRSRPRAFQS